MTVLSHYNRSKVRKRSSYSLEKAKLNKGTATSLLLLHYNILLKSLLKEANRECTNSRSKLTKAEHVKAVAKKVLLKYRR